MKENYTFFSYLAVFILFFGGGSGLTEARTQSKCGIDTTHWEILNEKLIGGILHKNVKFNVKSDKSLRDKYFFLIDDDPRDGMEKIYDFDYSDEAYFPLDAKKITIYDLNNDQCYAIIYPKFDPKICSFPVKQRAEFEEDCYNRNALFWVEDPDITIDSVAWLKDGGSESVYDQMKWYKIPPGEYEVRIFDDKGCLFSTTVKNCNTRANAGWDTPKDYCIDQGEILDVWSLLEDGVDPGVFHDTLFSELDSAEMREQVYTTLDTIKYYYITSAKNELPDTARIYINAMDCSTCIYEIESAMRLCGDQDSIEIVINNHNSEITAFEVTLPDGSVQTEVPGQPFKVYWTSLSDTLSLPLHATTANGVCDTLIEIGMFPMNPLQIDLQEEIIDQDSSAITIMVSDGTGPYQVDLTTGADQVTISLDENESHRFVISGSSDTVFAQVTDSRGCIVLDTLILTPDCAQPLVNHTPATCGENNGSITLDMGSLKEVSKIQWVGRSGNELWTQTGLAPQIYKYTITYDECTIQDSVVVLKEDSSFPEIYTENKCILDGKARFFIQDSNQVNQWFYQGQSLPHFSVELMVNASHSLTIETMDGCDTTIEISVVETPWLEELKYSEPNIVTAIPGEDQRSLTDFGWEFRSSELCYSCVEYTSETMLEEGIYTFFMVQDEECRRDTLLRVKQDERYFQIPNVLTPQKSTNNRIQIFDPMDQMQSIIEFLVYDRYGNILYEKHDILPDENAAFNWPEVTDRALPDMIICVARIKCKDDEEVTVSQDILILR